MSSRVMVPLVCVLVLCLAGCGYYNSLYNANRSFETAQRATRSGDAATASREYRAAIERAAVSYRKYPDSRWADDALLLLGRARFALGEYDAAAAAMRTLLEHSADPQMRSRAHAHLGASLMQLDQPAAAMVHLDSAAVHADSEDGAFTRLWRGRAAFRNGREAEGWAELAAALRGDGIVAHTAALDGVQRALEARDSARAFEFMAHLARTPHVAATLADVDSVLLRMGRDWSPTVAFESSAPLAESAWPAATRDAIQLSRARLAVQAGDAATALALATRVGNAVSLGVGSRARRLAAQIRLAEVDSAAGLEAVRTLLLPAYDDREALELLRGVRAAQILIENGSDPASSISLFAAAELLRDELAAPRLARRIFLDYATTNDNVWAGKAALAAHLIDADGETSAALERLRDNAYVRAAGGDGDPAEIDRAEARLAFGITGLRADARQAAISRDVVVGRAITVLDSTRTAARNDSVRIGCGMLIDSLALAGIRADSTRTACLRGDTARVRFVLGADTVALRDTTRNADPAVRPGGAVRDTLADPDTVTAAALTRR